MIKNYMLFKRYFFNFKKGDWGLGIGDLGIGDCGLGPIPNPQSPIPNPHPQSPIPIVSFFYALLKN